jgi:hypothetical protein
MTDTESPREFRARLMQDKVMVAQVFAPSFEQAEREGETYALVYQQDGPVDLQIAEKINRRWRLLGGAIYGATF